MGSEPPGVRALLAAELRAVARRPGQAVASLLFFVVAASLFPLAVGPEPAFLGRIAPGIVWVCALLGLVLPLERLFAADAEDGMLDQHLLSGLPPAAVALVKAAALWLTAGLPVVVVSVPLAVMLRVPDGALPPLLGGLLLGTPLLALLGTAASALVLDAAGRGVLLPLLVLPLSVPVLILGVGAADAAATGLTPRPHLLLLGALLAATAPALPLAAGAALRARS